MICPVLEYLKGRNIVVLQQDSECAGVSVMVNSERVVWVRADGIVVQPEEARVALKRLLKDMDRSPKASTDRGHQQLRESSHLLYVIMSAKRREGGKCLYRASAFASSDRGKTVGTSPQSRIPCTCETLERQLATD